MRYYVRPTTQARVLLSALFMLVAFAAACVQPASIAFAQDEGLAVGSASNPSAASSTGLQDYFSPDGQVAVIGISSGSVSYDAGSATLSLDGVTAQTIGLCKSGTVTLRLSGSNEGEISDSFAYEENDASGGLRQVAYDCTGSVRIGGNGSLAGPVDIRGAFEIEAGTIVAPAWGLAGISCATFTMSGGTVNSGNIIRCTKTLKVSGGTIDASGGGMSNLHIDRNFYKLSLCAPAIVVSGGTVKTSGVDCDTFTMSGGTLFSQGSVACLKSLTVKGGSLKAGDGLCCGGMVTVSKGKANGFVFCKALAVKGGELTTSKKGRLASIECARMTVTGGKVTIPAMTSIYGILCENLTVSGGAVALSKIRGGTAIECNKLVVKGGKVSIAGSNGIGVSCSSLAISKGALSVDNQQGKESILVTGGNLTMTGGTLKVTRGSDRAVNIKAAFTGGRSRTVANIGGKMIVKGGAVTVGVRKPAKHNAVAAISFSCKEGSIKSVKGRMPAGFVFSSAGNKYQVTATNYQTVPKSAQHAYRWSATVFRGEGSIDTWSVVPSDDSGSSSSTSASVASYSFISHQGKYPGVMLVKYNSSKTTATLATVKFGGCNYSVTGVGKNALSTARGAKVKSLTLLNTLYHMDANALAGAKSLATLQLELFVDATFSGGKLKAAKLGSGSQVAKSAFAKCGKSAGEGITVRLFPAGVYSRDMPAAKLKALLVKYGLPSKAKVVLWKR